ncbi:PQQ-dependent sugar dehydrogenase [Terasakiella sp. A23]|uniref:PQQ-dependent sugar dehydrogenase n=1 Tax=Terasakiella sp. FCG-A23 TaxID=3080561 RepID=UPI00295399C0|nr:PQQ-dependent sugar dehydrogenase [Terasakiella sp. A23]MDV7338268.1 PQQ-dependent sugar dehydrogenase [Terasakiella sp. A23]
MIRFSLFLTFLILSVANAQAGQTYHSDKHDFKVVEVASGLDHPWGFAFLPNGDILITERDGPRLRLIKQGRLLPDPVKGLPGHIFTAGQGGLLDVAVDPEFASNQFIYFSFAGQGAGGAGTEVARAQLVDDHLENPEIIFAVSPKTTGSAHYGSRLRFHEDGTLFITVGDRYSRMKQAQNPANHIGSIMRIHPDGTVPADNPFVNKPEYKPEIYSYGHRNPQGLAIRPSDQSIWAHEHGPRGGDEVNKLKPGANYGWPAITYGIDYSGAIISDKTHAPGMEQPIVYWDPSIAPSGMEFYTGDKFPNWKGNLFVGALAKRHLRRLTMKGDQVIEQEVLLNRMARIRDVRTGPDGYLYILTDKSNGQLLKLTPKGQ